MSKKIFFLTILVSSFLMIQIKNYATSDIKNTYYARVIEVIDVDTFKVVEGTNISPKKIKIVHLIGLNATNKKEAFSFVNNNVLGQFVKLETDKNQNHFKKSSYEEVYLFLNYEESLNKTLIKKGYATLDDSYVLAEQYQQLLMANKYVKTKSNQSKPVLNLNTASYKQLTTYLENTTKDIANSIIYYRKYNPFNMIEEVKYADSKIDYEWFNKNKSKLSVITNIHSASKEELMTLFPYSSNNKEEVVIKLLNYRILNNINTIDTFKNNDLLSSFYKDIKEYITLDSKDTYIPENHYIININTATADEIKRASNFSSTHSSDIVKTRNKTSYVFKNLSELYYFDNYLTKTDLIRNKDHFTCFTDINQATSNELKSLFGLTNAAKTTKKNLVKVIINNRPYKNINDLSNYIENYYFNKIKDFIYVNKSDIKERLNINLTKKTSLINYLDIPNDEAKKIQISNRSYNDTNDLDIEYKKCVLKFSFFTNINTASAKELHNLDSMMTNKLVNAILVFREDQPFTSHEEVEKFFESQNVTNVYNNIKEYIVFY